MASSIQLLRSTNPQERPFAGNLLEGQPAANLHSSEPGLFFKTTDGSVVKFGPAAITSDGSPPNSTPQGSAGNSVGELWLDKSVDPAVLKVYDGTQWVDAGSGSGGGSGSFLRWIYTAIGGETSLSGSSGGVLLDYTPGLEEVYVNGVLITRGTDYSAVNGTSITNLVPLTAGDVVTVLSMNPLETVQLPGQVTLLRWSILAAAGQTVLSGIDSSSQQLAYTAGFEEVYVNGVFLRRGLDYTATSGSSITISIPLAEDDEVTVMAWSPFEVGDIGTASYAVNVKDFGAKGDGVTNDGIAFINASKSVGNNQTLYIPPGHYILDSDASFSASLTNGQSFLAFFNKEGVCVKGDGSAAVTLEITGSQPMGLIYFSGCDRPQVKGMKLIGNNVAVSTSQAGNAVWFFYDDSHPDGIGNGVMDDIHAEEFSGVGWLYIRNNRSIGTIKNFTISNIYCRLGGDPNPSALGGGSGMIVGWSKNGGFVENVLINNCVCEAEQVKQGIALSGGFRRVSIDNCQVINCGAANPFPSTGRYGIMIYGAPEMYETAISNCIVDNGYDCNIYIVGSQHAVVTGCILKNHKNTIILDSNEKGALCFAGTDGVASGNLFVDNAVNIVSNPFYDGRTATFTGNKFIGGRSVLRAPTKTSEFPTSKNAYGGGFRSNDFFNSSITMIGKSGGGVDRFWYDFAIVDNTFTAGPQLKSTDSVPGAFISGATASAGLRTLHIEGNTFRCEAGTIMDRCISGQGGVLLGEGLKIKNNAFYGTFSQYTIAIYQTTGVEISDNHFYDNNPIPSGNLGYIFYTIFCEGIAENNRFHNSTTTARVLLQAGYLNDTFLHSVPNWTGNPGDRVQKVTELDLNQYYAWSASGSTWQLVTEW